MLVFISDSKPTKTTNL